MVRFEAGKLDDVVACVNSLDKSSNGTRMALLNAMTAAESDLNVLAEDESPSGEESKEDPGFPISINFAIEKTCRGCMQVQSPRG